MVHSEDWYACSKAGINSEEENVEARHCRWTETGFTWERTRILKSNPFQYIPGKSTPSPGSQMLYNNASMHPAAPGAVDRCEGRTGACGAKYVLKKPANASRRSGSPENPRGYEKCWKQPNLSYTFVYPNQDFTTYSGFQVVFNGSFTNLH